MMKEKERKEKQEKLEEINMKKTRKDNS